MISINNIDREYLKDILNIKLDNKQTSFHMRFARWAREVKRLNIKGSFDAVEKIDKIKHMYDWVECFEFLEYYKHLLNRRLI